MADDNVLRVGAVVAVADVRSGMQQASQATTEATSEMAEGFVQVNEAAKATQGTLTGYTEVVEVAAVANGHFTNSARAVSGALFEIEGHVPRRAIEQFIGQMEGLGPIVAAAFPVIGAIALGEIAVQMGEKLYEAFDIGGARARQTANDVRAVNDAFRDGQTLLDVQIDKLQQEQAKLEKKPFNGMKLVLDEAAEAAENLQKRLEGAVQAESKVVEGLSSGIFQRVFAGGSKTAYESTMLQEHTKWLDSASTAQQKLNESVSYGSTLQTRLNDLQQKESVATQITNDGGIFVTHYDQEIKAVQEMVVQQKQEQAGIQTTIALQRQQGATQGARDGAEAARIAAENARKAAAAQRQAEQEHMRAWEQDLVDMQAANGAFYQHGAADAAAYWRSILDTENLSSQQRLEVSRKLVAAGNTASKESFEDLIAMNKAAAEDDAANGDDRIAHTLIVEELTRATYGATSRQAQDAQRELTRVIEQEAQRQAAAQRKAAEDAAKARRPSELVQTGIVQQAGTRGSGIDQEAKQELSQGILTQQQYVQVVSQTENAVYAIKLDALQKRRALEAQDPNGAEETQRTDNEIEKLTEQHETRKTELAREGQQQRIQLINAEVQALGGGFTTALQGWERGNLSFTQGFAQMAGGLVTTLQGSLVQMGVKWAEHYILVNVLHMDSAASKAATDVTAQATQLATAATANAAQVLSEAAVASAAAFASTAAIPIVGLALAPEAAAGAYASVAAMAPLASAAGGWGMVPADGTLAELHKNEMVLPSSIADNIRNMSGGGDTITQHFGGNTFTGQTANFPQMLDDHEDALAAKMQSLKRDGKI